MTAREMKIKREGRSAAGDYFKKATDNYEQMVLAIEAGNHNAAGTLAVQCAISSADALCVFEKGIRSLSQDHFDVCELIESLPIPEAKEKAKALRKVIARKNLIQYERRNLTPSEAQEIVKLTSRLYHWVKLLLNEK
jgi:HEPN domain-containing protein